MKSLPRLNRDLSALALAPQESLPARDGGHASLAVPLRQSAQSLAELRDQIRRVTAEFAALSTPEPSSHDHRQQVEHAQQSLKRATDRVKSYVHNLKTAQTEHSVLAARQELTRHQCRCAQETLAALHDKAAAAKPYAQIADPNERGVALGKNKQWKQSSTAMVDVCIREAGPLPPDRSGAPATIHTFMRRKIGSANTLSDLANTASNLRTQLMKTPSWIAKRQALGISEHVEQANLSFATLARMLQIESTRRPVPFLSRDRAFTLNNPELCQYFDDLKQVSCHISGYIKSALILQDITDQVFSGINWGHPPPVGQDGRPDVTRITEPVVQKIVGINDMTAPHIEALRRTILAPEPAFAVLFGVLIEQLEAACGRLSRNRLANDSARSILEGETDLLKTLTQVKPWMRSQMDLWLASPAAAEHVDAMAERMVQINHETQQDIEQRYTALERKKSRESARWSAKVSTLLRELDASTQRSTHLRQTIDTLQHKLQHAHSTLEAARDALDSAQAMQVTETVRAQFRAQRIDELKQERIALNAALTGQEGAVLSGQPSALTHTFDAQALTRVTDRHLNVGLEGLRARCADTGAASEYQNVGSLVHAVADVLDWLAAEHPDATDITDQVCFHDRAVGRSVKRDPAGEPTVFQAFASRVSARRDEHNGLRITHLYPSLAGAWDR